MPAELLKTENDISFQVHQLYHVNTLKIPARSS